MNFQISMYSNVLEIVSAVKEEPTEQVAEAVYRNANRIFFNDE